ncbi:hypothetical protein [Oceanospirillum sp.]|uniref:hypothetical protein n=1 Tax=Oceanospirillum sp. TaxID=2021254 RepID=UPI003A93DE55
MKYTIENIELVLEAKLKQLAEELSVNDAVAGRGLRIVDLGVFPWFQTIEISFLFEGDKIIGMDDIAADDEIADWPFYDLSGINEGRWPEAEALAADLAGIWNDSDNPELPPFLHDFAKACQSPRLKQALSGLNLADDFTFQILNADLDDSPNYCEWN